MSWRVPQKEHERVSETGVFPSLDRVSGTLCLSRYMTEISHLYSVKETFEDTLVCVGLRRIVTVAFLAPCTNILTYLLTYLLRDFKISVRFLGWVVLMQMTMVIVNDSSPQVDLQPKSIDLPEGWQTSVIFKIIYSHIWEWSNIIVRFIYSKCGGYLQRSVLWVQEPAQVAERQRSSMGAMGLPLRRRRVGNVDPVCCTDRWRLADVRTKCYVVVWCANMRSNTDQ